MTAAVRAPIARLAERLPTDEATIGAAGAATVATVATIGFGSSLAGIGPYVAVLLGATVAGTLAWVAARRTWSGLTQVGTNLAALMLLAGPLAAPEHTLAGVVPGPRAIAQALDALVHGWRELASLAAPAVGARHLLVLPLFCAFTSTALSAALSRWRHAPLAALVPPCVALGVVTAEGTATPYSLLLQGGVLLAVLVLWARNLLGRTIGTGGHFGARNKVAGTAAMLALMVLGAPLLGPHLPYANGGTRYLMRDHVDVPFDPNDYPSPLSQFRAFRRDRHERPNQRRAYQDQVLLSVSGLPAGSTLRFAVMADYDGVVWRVSSPAAPNPFGRAAGTLSPRLPGRVRRVRVTVPKGGLDGVWLPLAGTPTDIDFFGPRGDKLRDMFRYSRGLGAGAVIGGLEPGDSYAFEAAFPDSSRDCAIGTLGPADLGPVSEMPKAIADRATKVVTGKEPTGLVRAQIQRIRAALDGPNGYYGDGEDPFREPGHYAGLLNDFVSSTTRLGNDEQYAAAAALYARANSIPARVVLGATPAVGSSGDGVVRRRDVRAWIEVPDAEGRWIPCQVTPKRTDDDYQQKDPPPDPRPTASPQVIVPPNPPQADDLGDLTQSNAARQTKVTPPPPPPPKGSGRQFWLVLFAGLPVVLVVAPFFVIPWLKRRRRRTRRSQGSPADRVLGAWRDVTDLTLDLGWPVATNATRRELAAMHGRPEMVELAGLIDLCTFGPVSPQPDQVGRTWDLADRLRSGLLAGVRRTERVRAVLSLASLRQSVR
jgi:hypothetical protein